MVNKQFTVNKKGHMEVGGCDTVELAKKYGTPLFVYDIEKVRANCRAFVDTLKELDVPAHVTYASKAFSSIAILQVIAEEGLGVDVVSAGELYTALKAGIHPEKIHFHGNNKSRAELQMAVESGIGCIIIDNFHEIALLDDILKTENKTMRALIRVTPGIESETHKYIMTGNEDSKFGFNLANGQAEEAFLQLKDHKRIHLLGLHSHIGSQIFTSDSFVIAAEVLFETIEKWHAMYHFTPEVMNLGGGFGIKYTADDQPIPLEDHVKNIIGKVETIVERMGIDMPEIWLEPGRSIVGDAGISLYEVGSTKTIEGVRNYVAVDGGMNDNIRPALYDAQYDGVIANKVNEDLDELVSIAGKCCESGDMLIWDLQVPKIEQGDIFAMLSTGAYGYAMASNYNRLERPAVVFCENGLDQLVIKRESLEDLIKNDLSYKNNEKEEHVK